MKNILTITLLILSVLYAKPCMTDIYTGNGIMTNDASPSQAENNMIALKLHMLYKANGASRLDPQKYGKDYQFKYIHNPSYGFVNDILETFYGLKETGQISEGYFTFILNITTGNLTIDEAVQKYRQIVSTYEKDVSSIYNQYVASSFYKKHNVLLVAHSQGNIVGNKIFTKLTSSQIKKFRMVSVATPANSVAGGGPHVTVHGDGVIQPVPGALSSNVGGTGHNFITTYLDAHSNARNLIAQHVKSAYRSLFQTSSCTAEYEFVKVLMPSFGQLKIVGLPFNINAYEDIGELSLPLRDAEKTVINGITYYSCSSQYAFYASGEVFGNNWAYYGDYGTSKSIEWLPGRIHNKQELDSRINVREEVLSDGAACLTMSLEKNKKLYNFLSNVLN
jgi:hypothetical protein